MRHSFWIGSIDLKNRVVKVSIGIEQMLGCTPEEFAEDYNLWANNVPARRSHCQSVVQAAFGRSSFRSTVAI
ncbi:hypothetical protein [Domibacillus iocasae]|uniref:PAS domain-containing protein n=1 Tax=Domibacillus iocasae TaxID=1714016 RepID=A0A1E7DNG2_9BACI|nr:hypothetical protein [Domibacillus iocasae]OES44599.1 hypothetical protein BA724_10060 [Domibacillus iocasae]